MRHNHILEVQTICQAFEGSVLREDILHQWDVFFDLLDVLATDAYTPYRFDVSELCDVYLEVADLYKSASTFRYILYCFTRASGDELDLFVPLFVDWTARRKVAGKPYMAPRHLLVLATKLYVKLAADIPETV